MSVESQHAPDAESGARNEDAKDTVPAQYLDQRGNDAKSNDAEQKSEAGLYGKCRSDILFFSQFRYGGAELSTIRNDGETPDQSYSGCDRRIIVEGAD